MTKKYIFGYGSLVNLNSVKKTLKKRVKSIPVIFQSKNYSRKWVCLKKRKKLTLKKQKSNENINGILIPVDSKDLKLFNKREKSYDKIKLDIKYFKSFNNDKIPKGDVFTYVAKNKYNNPKKKCKLAQNYMDVVMQGFLKHGKNFTRKFKTKIKKKYTLNNRNKKGKLYILNSKNKKNLFKSIDNVIKENDLYTKN